MECPFKLQNINVFLSRLSGVVHVLFSILNSFLKELVEPESSIRIQERVDEETVKTVFCTLQANAGL